MKPPSGPEVQRVYQGLLARLQSGEFPAGSRLPSYLQLAREYGVADLTVRRAVAALEGEGRVARRPGRGTFVLDPVGSEAPHRPESEPRLQLDLLPVPLYLWRGVGDDWVLEEYNQAADEYTQGALRGMQGAPALRIFPQRPDVLEDFRRCAETGDELMRRLEWQLSATGERKLLEVTYIPVRPDGVLIHTVDRTAEETAMRSLQGSLRHLRAVVENTPVSLWALAADGTFTLAEGGAFVRGGLQPGEAIGQSAFEHWRAYPAVVDAARRSLAGDAVELRTTLSERVYDVLFQPILAEDGAIVGSTGIARDVTEQVQAEQERRRSEVLYRSLFETSPDGIVVADAAATIIMANRRIGEMLDDPSPEALIGTRFSDLFAAPTRREVLRRMMSMQHTTGRARNVEVVLQRRDGATFPAEVNGSWHFDESGRPVHYTAVLRDITERHLAAEQLRFQAHHDGLTGLPNRWLFGDRLTRALSDGHRSGEPVSVLLLDLDHFKEVNDTLGHQVGDQLLQQVGARFARALRDRDTVARFGGDEFAVLLPGTDADGAVTAAAKLLSRLSEPISLAERTIYVNASIGIAVYPANGADRDTLLRQADVAMYRAKRDASGYALYEERSDPFSSRRLALIAGLRQAIDCDELELHFQPKVDLRTGRASAVEALARWQHPTEGAIPPSEFIPIAEQTGLIRQLTIWVVREALRQVKRWNESGIDIAVAVNLSIWNLQDPSLVESVAQLLSSYEIDPAVLTLEITESTLMSDPVRGMEMAGTLRELGAKISIDDFGTGYSSLSYVHHFAVQELKIDRSFVARLATGTSRDISIVRTMLQLGQSLDLQIVAEGVETQRHVDQLVAMGCDYAQGYFFSPPLPADELLGWLQRKNSAMPVPV